MKNSRKVNYFATHGQAEAIRMLLHHAKAIFIDERLSKEEFATRKTDFPAGQLPCYTDDQGRMFNQSQAILRALGIEFDIIQRPILGKYGPVTGRWIPFKTLPQIVGTSRICGQPRLQRIK